MTIQELRDLLEILSFVAQIISFPVAAIAIFLSRTEAKSSRDLQVALNLSDSFRRHWENNWEEKFTKIRKFQNNQPEAQLTEDDEKQLRFMLNWIDWLGTFIRTKSFSNPKIILSSINRVLTLIINSGRYIIEKDIKKHGVEHWAGVLTVSKCLKINWTDSHNLNLDRSDFHLTN